MPVAQLFWLHSSTSIPARGSDSVIIAVSLMASMHDSMERSTAAAALASLFYSADSTAAHERDVERRPGPLRRARGASTPIKKMAATPYHQVASTPAPGIHSGVGPPESAPTPESHGPTSAPTPRTAAPTSESTSEDKHPWGCGPWGALAAPSGSAQTVLPPLAYVPPAPLRPTSSVPPEREPPPPLAPQARFGPPPASYMPLVPPAATKKPPRAKKANPCASRTARAPLHYSSTPTPPPRHLHATSAPPS